jgi:hypothetical protein
MGNRVTPREARALLNEYLRGHTEPRLGLILEPPNPFQPEARRKLRRGFVLFAFLLLAAVGVFVYFNLGS